MSNVILRSILNWLLPDLAHLVSRTEGVLIRDAFPDALFAVGGGSGNSFLVAHCVCEGIAYVLVEVRIGILSVAAFLHMVIRIA